MGGGKHSCGNIVLRKNASSGANQPQAESWCAVWKVSQNPGTGRE